MLNSSKLYFPFTLDRGLLVAFEGVDRAGKSTQTELLLKWVQESSVPKFLKESGSPDKTKQCSKTELIKFPERSTPVGKIIDSYLRKLVWIR